MNPSSAAVHFGVLVADGIEVDDYDLGGHFFVVHNSLVCHLIDREHFVLDAFLQEHFLFLRIAGILIRVQREELVGAVDRDFQ